MSIERPFSENKAEARASQIRAVLNECIHRRLSGEPLTDEQVVADHPGLLPDLEHELKKLRRIQEARLQANETASVDLEPPDLTQDDAPLDLNLPGYELVREISRGGQAVVYQALHHATKRRVAIKVMHEGPLASRRDRLRFEREVEVLAHLDHPNVVIIHDSGSVAGTFYFVMDYISGQPLDLWVDSEQRPLEEALRLFAGVCDAVNAAHLRGVIHRDLKPSNIIVDPEGQPHVLDFGLAKVTGKVEPSLMTVTGQFVGSMQWASPGHAEGIPEKIDLRTDVYSLGVILYYMLTGNFPYEVVGNVRDVLDRILNAEPFRPSTVRPQIDDEVETIVLKCLAKERERRYQSAGELARDIRRHLAGEPIEAKRDSTLYVLRKHLRRHRLAITVATAFIVLVTASLGVSTALWRRAARERDLASEERDRASAASIRAAGERDRAEREKTRADERGEELRRTLYISHIALTDNAIRDNAIAKARQELEKAPPDMRGWEWYSLCAESDTSLHTLRGHKSWVFSVSFSPDGKRIVSAGQDGTVKLWNAETGAEQASLGGETGYVYSVSFSSDGRRIVAGSQDGSVKLWDANTGAELRTLRGHEDKVWCVAFSPDGQRIVSGSQDKTLKLWDTQTGAELHTLRGHKNTVGCVLFTPDGRRIVSGSYGTVYFWDAHSGATLGRRALHEDWVTSISFSRDGRQMVSASKDKTVKLWAADTGAEPEILRGELRTLRGHVGCVCSVSFSPDGSRVISGSMDNTVRLWDVKTGAELRTFRGHEHWVWSVSFSLDGQRIISGSGDNTVKVWETNAEAEPRRLSGHEDAIWSVGFGPDGQRIVSGSKDHTVKLWDTETGAELHTLRGHEDMVFSVSFSPDGRRIVSGSTDGTVRVWDAKTGAKLHVLRGHEGDVTSVSISADGGQIISGGEDHTVKLWDAKTGAELRTLNGHEDAINCVSFAPDGRRIVSGSSDNTAKLWDTETGADLRTLRGHEDTVVSVAFSPDGRRIASGSVDKTVKLWETETGSEVRTLHGHEDRVVSVSFSPDGRRIVTASQHGTVKLWDAVTGAELHALPGQEEMVFCVSFSPDGRRIVSAGSDRIVRLWDSVPHAQRYRERQLREEAKPKVEALVDRKLQELSDETAAIQEIKAGNSVPELVRRMALNMLLQRLDRTPPEATRLPTTQPTGQAATQPAASG